MRTPREVVPVRSPAKSSTRANRGSRERGTPSEVSSPLLAVKKSAPEVWMGNERADFVIQRVDDEQVSFIQDDNVAIFAKLLTKSSIPIKADIVRATIYLLPIL